MYNNLLPQQSLPQATHTNPNQQHMQYNPEYYQYHQQQQLMLLEEQNRRLAADRYSQHMVGYPQTNMPNNLQHQHHPLHICRHANAEMNATFHNKDGQPWKEGDVYTRPKYADTLEVSWESTYLFTKCNQLAV